jgi:2-polyprenyl-6-methoxyphenol hydroxylase-like FAD-dependent oxidoreductase
MRIAIVGYGTAGQSAALLLAQDGHQLEVFERAPELGPVGAGLLLQPTGLWVLWNMGLLKKAFEFGAPVRRLFGDSHSGRPVMDMRYDALDRRLIGLGIQRGALFELLRQAWPDADTVRTGRAVVSIDLTTKSLTDDTGERHGPFDLIIVADGAASLLRDIVGPVHLNRPYPWGALWCLLPQGEWEHGDELRQRYRAARRMMGLLPVGTRPGDPVPRLSFFWSLPSAAFAAWRETGFDNWKQEAAELWPQASNLLTHIDHPAHLLPATYRDASLKRWQRAPIVLLGDAAHAMSPQLGQGVNMALMDAFALREALRDARDLADALPIYERTRQVHARIYQFWSRWLTPLFQSERDLAARLRDMTFIPMARLPISRGQMLRVLTGTQKGWFGRFSLPERFLDDLAGFHAPM